MLHSLLNNHCFLKIPNNNLWFLLFLIIYSSHSLQPVSSWNYQKFDDWDGQCNVGSSQSPIAVSAFEAIYSDQLEAKNKPITFINYNQQYDGTLKNTGATVSWTINSQQLPKIILLSSSTTTTNYALNAIHFHWGNVDQLDGNCQGSEHVIEHSRAPMEAHFVHYNTKYTTYDEAKTMADGLAVLAFQYSSVPTGTVTSTDYSAIANSLNKITEPNNSIDRLVDVGKLIPADIISNNNNSTMIIFRYEGSLTTPPCSETVTWTLFAHRLAMPVSQLDAFRSLLLTDGGINGGNLHTLKDNFRPIQRRNNRIVLTNSPLAVQAAAANSRNFGGNKLLLLILTALLLLTTKTMLTRTT